MLIVQNFFAAERFPNDRLGR